MHIYSDTTCDGQCNLKPHHLLHCAPVSLQRKAALNCVEASQIFFRQLNVQPESLFNNQYFCSAFWPVWVWWQWALYVSNVYREYHCLFGFYRRRLCLQKLVLSGLFIVALSSHTARVVKIMYTCFHTCRLWYVKSSSQWLFLLLGFD